MPHSLIHTPTNIPELKLARPNGKVVASIESFEAIFKDLVASYRDDNRTLLISIDGKSGAGKTTTVQKTEGVIADVNSRVKINLASDSFITDERGSEARSRYLETPERFYYHLSDRQRIQWILSQICLLGPSEGEIPLGNLYNGKSGLLEPGGSLKIPSGNKVIVFEGTDATRIVAGMPKPIPVNHIPLMVHSPLEMSIQNACLRDEQKGKPIDFDHNAFIRIQENALLIPYLTNSLLTDARVIFDNTEFAKGMADMH